MLALSEFFGSLERLVGELYAYRVLISALALVGVGAAAFFAHRAGLDRAAARWTRAHRSVAAAIAVAALVVVVPVGSYTLSPLWTRSNLEEASPFEVSGDAKSAAVAQPSAPAPVGGDVSGRSKEGTTSDEHVRVVRAGELSGADAFHFGRGRVRLIDGAGDERVLRFDSLSVRNGPDLFVYLSSAPDSVTSAVNLGTLKATDGSFNYEVPEGVDGSMLDHVLIWCRQFGVLFASAALRAP